MSEQNKEIPRMMRIAFTGHRPNKLGGYDNSINKRNHFLALIGNFVFSSPIIDYYLQRQLLIISGMAQGVDTWAAEFAVSTGIPFDAYIPCYQQEQRLPTGARRHYWDLIRSCRSIIQVSTLDYTPELMQKRNEAMVNNCDLLIAYWDGSTGGTANCVQYAVNKGKEIKFFHPETAA